MDEVPSRGTALGGASIANPKLQKKTSRGLKGTIQTEPFSLSDSTKGKTTKSEKHIKERPKKISYETKAARKAARKKQYSKLK